MKLYLSHSATLLILLFFVSSCKEVGKIGGKYIQFGDSTTIITETDSNYLANYTKDISDRTQDESEIARIMVQVDSVKISKELEKFTSSDSSISGFSVKFEHCEVVFDGLEAKELKPQNPETNRSVSYLVTKGDLSKMKLRITGLTEVAVKERIDTRLKVANEKEELLLKSLGRKRSDWFPLPGKQNIFVAAGENSAQFNNLSNAKLKEALKKELLAKKRKPAAINEWLKLVEKTNDYTDYPCKLYVATAQFRITGKNKNGLVNKLIQFDIVE